MVRSKIILLVASVAIALGAYIFASRRATLTDPAEIAKLAPDELRDAEVECLVRAMLAGARSIHIKSEAAPSITVSDPATLRRLSNEFAVGYDAEQLSLYRHPGLEYTLITFDGRDDPKIGFTGPKSAMLMSGEPGNFRHFGVRTKFARLLADLLHLELASGAVERKRRSK